MFLSPSSSVGSSLSSFLQQNGLLILSSYLCNMQMTFGARLVYSGCSPLKRKCFIYCKRPVSARSSSANLKVAQNYLENASQFHSYLLVSSCVPASRDRVQGVNKVVYPFLYQIAFLFPSHLTKPKMFFKISCTFVPVPQF
jgi:hypothetical protein